MPEIQFVSDNTFDTLMSSVEQRFIALNGEASLMVCPMNKQLVIEMIDLLDDVIRDISEYITSGTGDIICVKEAILIVGLYLKIQNHYRDIIDSYDEFLSKLSPSDLEIAMMWSRENPVRPLRIL